MRVTVRAPTTHLCPFVDERDLGTIEASWDHDHELAYDLHTFATYLGMWANEKITHEDLTERTVEHLRDAGCEGVEVVTRWRTAGLDVEVRAS
jgi:NADPH-dependent 7-cyano-7-deazaguanine reductase QueF